MKESRLPPPIRRLCSALLLIRWIVILSHYIRGTDAFSVLSSLPSSRIIRPAAFSSSIANNKPIRFVSSANTRIRCPINNIKYPTILSLADVSADNNNEVDNTNVTTPQTSPPFLSLGYTLAAIMNAAAAMSLIWGSCASKESLLSSVSASSLSASVTKPLLPNNHHYWDPTFTSSFLSYVLLGAGTCQLLSNITKKHPPSPQQKDAHQQQQQQLLLLRQRLTMGTLLFSIIGLFSVPGEASYHYHPPHNQVKFATSLLLCQLSKLITATISFIGWEATIIPGGFGNTSLSSRCKNILREIIHGIKSTCQTLPITESHPASFYRTFFIFVTLGNVVLNVPNLMFYLRETGGMNWFSIPVSLIVSSIGRGSLLSVILFVLKEEHASSRSGSRVDSIDKDDDDDDEGKKKKRTKGSGTFVALNMMVGLWAVGVGISQGFVEGIPFNIRRAADKFLFGLLFLNNGVLMQLTKMGWIKDRDEIDPNADPPLRIGL